MAQHCNRKPFIPDARETFIGKMVKRDAQTRDLDAGPGASLLRSDQAVTNTYLNDASSEASENITAIEFTIGQRTMLDTLPIPCLLNFLRPSSSPPG